MKKSLAAILILTAALLTACSGTRTLTRYENRETAAARADTVRLVQLQRDSVFLHDSVFVSVETRGDTVYLTKAVTRCRDRDRIVRDTVYRAKTDTVKVAERKWREKETERASRGVLWLAATAAFCVLAVWIVNATVMKE